VRAAEHGRGLQLEVSTRDGRSATRQVHDPDELLMTLQALVLVPPSPSAARSESVQPTTLESKASASTPQPEAAAPSRYDSDPRKALLVEIGAALMGRLGFLPDYISPALLLSVGMHLERFTLGMDVRWNPFQTLIARPHPTGLEIESLGAGFFAIYRMLDSEVTGLDLGVHAFLSADTRALEEDETATESTVVDGRFGVLARWGIGSRTGRWVLLLDAELSPARLRSHGAFPVCSVGVGAGGVWEVK
jgi:hypothetical protein